ncbi:MAG TPA: HIT domain-containing protein [Xanthomonadales bacterium]
MTELHPRLAADCIRLGRLELCHLLLMNDASYPWFILVPDRDGIREIFELDAADRQQLLDESCRLSEFLMSRFKGDKLNVAAIGNLVPQLHLHHVVRFQADRAWPKPVWGQFPALAYTDMALAELRARLNFTALADFEPLL